MTIERTLIETIKKYEEKGYRLRFKLTSNCLKCIDSSEEFEPENFNIIETHRFDGMSSAGDESVLYVIEAENGQKKGLLIDAYGTYSDSLSFEMLHKLAQR